jgi:hypothetical protein
MARIPGSRPKSPYCTIMGGSIRRLDPDVFTVLFPSRSRCSKGTGLGGWPLGRPLGRYLWLELVGVLLSATGAEVRCRGSDRDKADVHAVACAHHVAEQAPESWTRSVAGSVSSRTRAGVTGLKRTT